VTEPGGATAPLPVESDGPDETRALAAALSGVCRGGDVVLLVGDLGAGKTTFAQGFGQALGIAEPITSPTFTLVRRYPLDPEGSPASSPSSAARAAAAARGIRALVHADVYRLDTLGEIADLGLAELIEDGGVALVEWGDVAVGVLGSEWLSVRLEFVADKRRRLTFVGSGPSWSERWPPLTDAFGESRPRAAGGSRRGAAGR
jgi:tRNA threonylcarbamoyladenosine biosynthesis protein TsaE